jgi:hypothetical protein
MRAHYLRTAKQLKVAIHQLEQISANNDIAELHSFVVELKTSLPERIAYEKSPILLDGLRVNSADDLPAYVERLRSQLQILHDDYRARSK